MQGKSVSPGAQEYHEPEYFLTGETYDTTMVYLYGVFKKGYNPDKNLTSGLFGRKLRQKVNITNTKDKHSGTPVKIIVKRT